VDTRYFVCNDVLLGGDVVSAETNRIVKHNGALKATQSSADGRMLTSFLGPRLADGIVTRAKGHRIGILFESACLSQTVANPNECKENARVFQAINVYE
jgi:hypothetical protein